MQNIARKTHTINADGQILGRLASRIAALLTGKIKRDYAPNIDGGDFVIVNNVAGVKVTGKKISQKEYKYFSGYPGGLKSVKWETILTKNPKKLLWLAVYRMLPKNRLRSNMIKRLKVQ